MGARLDVFEKKKIDKAFGALIKCSVVSTKTGAIRCGGVGGGVRCGSAVLFFSWLCFRLVLLSQRFAFAWFCFPSGFAFARFCFRMVLLSVCFWAIYISVEIRNISFGIRNISLGIRNISFGIRNISGGIRNITGGIRNIS